MIDHARDISYVSRVVSHVRLKNDPVRQSAPAPQKPGTTQPVATAKRAVA